jgi:hypothetical protein
MVCIYVLRCEEGKYYVGRASNIYKRITDHFIGNGSQWTKLHKPIDIEEVLPNLTELDEDKITKKYMANHGILNVRGGSYSNRSLTPNQFKFLCKELRTANNTCYTCGSKEHYTRRCPDKYNIQLNSMDFNSISVPESNNSNNQSKETVCLNCGLVDLCYNKCIIDSIESDDEVIDINHNDLDCIWKEYIQEKQENDDDLIKMSSSDYENIWISFENKVKEDLNVDVCLLCSEHGHCWKDCQSNKFESLDRNMDFCKREKNLLLNKRFR